MEESENKKNEEQENEKRGYKIKVNEHGKKEYTFKNFEDYPFLIDSEYDLDTIKGWGTYSTVCSGRNNITNQLVAIKRIHRVFDDLGDTRRILR